MREADVFLEGIQERTEPESIVERLNQPLKVFQLNTRPRWLAGARHLR